MKITLSWLKQHLETEASLDDIVERLTMIGLEVEEVEDRAAAYAPFVIARVISAEKHPNADRLRVCMVDPGDGVAAYAQDSFSAALVQPVRPGGKKRCSRRA